MDSDVKTSNRKGLNNSILGTRNLMVTAALTVVGSIILIPLNYVSISLTATPTQNNIFYGATLMGLWIIPFLLPAAVVRRPGTFLVTGLIAGIIGMLTTPLGPSAIAGNLIGAGFAGLPLLLTFYRWWNWKVYLLSALVFGGANGYMYTVSLGVSFDTYKTLQVVAVAIVSATLGVIATLGIVSALHKAGVGNQH